ncbi:hypothetical protein ACHQM5_009748 [Ranunculus cassubicifolius]
MAKARLYDWTKRWEEQTEENREHLWTELKQLTAQEWNSLVQFWDTQAHIIEEEGAPPNLGDFYVRTRTSSRTNDMVDEASRAYIVYIAGTDEDCNQQPITEEIYRQVMPPPRNRRMRRCFAPRVIAYEGNRMYHVIELQNELAELKKRKMKGRLRLMR